MRRRILALLPLLALGCAREVEPQAPGLAGAGQPVAGAYGYAWPPRVILTDPAAPTSPAGWAQPVAANSPGTVAMSSNAIPVGPACLERLGELGVRHQQLGEKRGVQTPVQVSDWAGGIRYFANGNIPLVCDCRLAVALHQIAPLLRSHGITAIRFSGAYVYRTTRSGRPSLHARGLAIDIHEFEIAGHRHSVKSHFQRGLGDGCAAGAPPLNRIACALRRTGLFRELLTPDYDRDHHDHFHLGLAPNESPAGAPTRLAAQPR